MSISLGAPASRRRVRSRGRRNPPARRRRSQPPAFQAVLGHFNSAPMLLKQLIQTLRPYTVEGPVDREVAGIAYDSRRVTPGMVFVAIPGRQTDGHEFIEKAIERGASAVIC